MKGFFIACYWRHFAFIQIMLYSDSCINQQSYDAILC